MLPRFPNVPAVRPTRRHRMRVEGWVAYWLDAVFLGQSPFIQTTLGVCGIPHRPSCSLGKGWNVHRSYPRVRTVGGLKLSARFVSLVNWGGRDKGCLFGVVPTSQKPTSQPKKGPENRKILWSESGQLLGQNPLRLPQAAEFDVGVCYQK